MKYSRFLLVSLLSLSPCYVLAQDTGSAALSSLISDCNQYLTICVPTAASCASSACSFCTSIGITPSIEPCCAQATPTACFKSSWVSQALTGKNTITNGPAATVGSGPNTAAYTS